MALDWQVKTIPLGGGVHQKVDPKLLPDGNLLLLENGWIKRTGEIQKRNGYGVLSATDFDGGNIGSYAQGLFSYQDELVLITGSSVYSYSEHYGAWKKKDFAKHVTMSAQRIGSARNTVAEAEFKDDAVVQSDVVFSQHESVQSDSRTSAFDYDSATEMLPFETGTFGTHMFSMPGNGKIGSVRSDTPELDYFFYVVSTLAKTNVTGIVTDFAAGGPYGAEFLGNDAVWGDLFVVAYEENGANDLRVRIFDHTGTQRGATYTYVAAALVPEVIGIATDTTLKVAYVFFYDNANGTYVVGIDGDGTERFAPVQIDAGVAQDTYNITGIVSGGVCHFFYTVEGSSTIDVPPGGAAESAPFRKVKDGQVTSAGVVSGLTNTKLQVGVISQPFVLDGTVVVLVSYIDSTDDDTAIQSSVFIIDRSGNIHARLLVGEHLDSYNPSNNERIPLRHVTALSSGDYVFAIPRRTSIVTPALGGPTGVGSPAEFLLITISSQAPGAPSWIDSNGTLMIAAGDLALYDGNILTTSGFHLYPSVVNGVAGGGGALAAGNYGVLALYEWYDDNGNRYQSAPSVAHTGIVVGAAGTIAVTVPNLLLSSKSSAPNIVLYCTDTDGTVYFRTANAPRTAPNTQVLTAAESGAALTGNEQLYTTGGVLDNVAPPSPHFITSDKHRAYLIPANNRRILWLSKPIVDHEGIAFSDSLVLDFPADEDLEAIVIRDGTKLAFTGNQIWGFTGDGPNSLGIGEYSKPQIISKDVGCINYKSIAEVPDGTLFQSKRGFYLLDRNLQTSYIGAPIEDESGAIVRRAILFPDRNQVRIFTSGGKVLVWDYYHKVWSVWVYSSTEFRDAAVWQGDVVMLNEDTYGSGVPELYWDEGDSFADGASAITLKVRTPWVKLAGLAGFQRVRRFMIAGEFRSAHSIVVKVYYDYDATTVVETFTVASTEIQTVATDGYLFRERLARQRCTAIMLEISDASQTGTKESFTLTGVAFEVGLKKGLRRVAGDDVP